MKLVNHLPLK